MQLPRQLNLLSEPSALYITRRKITVIIQPAFPYGYDLRLSRKLAELLNRICAATFGIMGMHASRRVQFTRITSRILSSLPTAPDTGSGNN